MNVTLILAGAVSIMVLMGASAYRGYGLGEDHVRAEDAAAQVQAQKEANKYANGLRASARKQAQTLQTSLAKQRGLNRAIGTDLEEALRKAAESVPAGCPAPALSDGLLNLWNRANHATGDASGRGLLIPGGPPAAPAGAVPGRSNPEPR